MVRGNTGTSSRAKSTLPLTRKFVPPRRLGVVTPKEDIPTSSLTPVEDDDDDEDEESEEKEVEIKQDKGKGKMIDTDITKPIKPSGNPTTIIQADEEASKSEDKSSNVLKTVQALTEEYTLRQKQLETFMSEATSSIAKLEERIVGAQSRNEDDEKCRESLSDLKALMADTLKQSTVPIVGIESAGSFGDFNNQQARTQSHLSRFTQLDSDEDSTQSLRTIDPKVLRPSYQGIRPAPPPTSSPDPPSSSVIPSSPPREQAESWPSPPSPPSPGLFGFAEDTPASDPDTDPIDIPPHSSPLFIPSPPSSPYQPSSSAAAAASSLMSIAHSDYRASSPPSASPTHEATQLSPSPPLPPCPPPPPPLPTQPTPSTEDIHHLADQAVKTIGSKKRSRRQTTTPLPTQPTLSTSDIHHLADQAVKAIGSKKRSRRQTTTPLPVHISSSPMSPPPKRLKSRKTVSKESTKLKTKKKRSTGGSGSLPLGTLGRSNGAKRVLGANWPKIGPNTVIGLAGNIECEQCLGPVHRSCAGLMDNEEIPDLAWICPDCDFIREHGGPKLPMVTDPDICIRSNCIRRRNAKIEWKPTDPELYVIKQAIGRRPLQPERGWSKGIYEYLTSWYGYPTNESTWEPIESFVAAEEMARQFIQSAQQEGAAMEQGGQGVILLDEAKEAFDENGDLRV